MPAARRRHGLAAATVLVALAGLPSCGGGGGGDGARGAGELTRAEFIAQGDQICRQAREEFLAADPSAPTTPEDAAALQRTLIHNSEQELDRIRALDAPSEIEPALDRYLRAREQGIALLKRGLEAAEDGDARAYAAAQRQVASGQVNRLNLAQAVGFDECSAPGGSSSAG
jgi:hypothetical protein